LRRGDGLRTSPCPNFDWARERARGRVRDEEAPERWWARLPRAYEAGSFGSTNGYKYNKSA
jgi:hypothetical protein